MESTRTTAQGKAISSSCALGGSGVGNLNPAGRLLSAIVVAWNWQLRAWRLSFFLQIPLIYGSPSHQALLFLSALPVRAALSVTLGYSGSAACVMLTASPHVSQAWQGGIAVTALLVCCQSGRQESGSQPRTRSRMMSALQRLHSYMNDGSVHIITPAHGEPWPLALIDRPTTSLPSFNYTLVLYNTSSFSSSSLRLQSHGLSAGRLNFHSTSQVQYLPADDEWRGLAQDVWEHAGSSANAVRRTWLCIP